MATTDKYHADFLIFEALFKSLYKPLRAYARRFVGDQAMAEDIVQDVFFELWSRREYIFFDQPLMVKAYLFRSVHNHSMNMLNYKLLKGEHSLEEANESSLLDTCLNPYMNQEQSLLLKELENEIACFIKTLPPQCRKTFILSRIHELKNKEIAQQMGVSIKAVEKQISKALRELNAYLVKKGLIGK
jgi:RNA polymerase sigma-70 factor (ECF subfamily)